ncbi:phosphonate ABC transporter, permease protein PhnE [Actinopolymorpha pittospori]|uniref:Phosphonate transport system permease protein n=1 Tax=Actinopolymorpha pittospori TaxID=648752 RepID=A0A927MYV2_9ACTN|nr:phosphonate transport system permease protein [Actinopolymorpha pittospori]
MIDLRINVATFIDGYGNAVDFLRRTVPLRLPPLDEIWSMVGQTLAIVVLGTVLAYLLSVPVALLAAENTTINKPVRAVARILIVVARAMPELIIAMFFLRVFGLGALPGILALGLGSIGMMAKLFTDAIEELDAGPREALRATGATNLQQIVGAVIPALKPAMVATTLHRFDINLRGSVILGFVGVGGIGLQISAALQTLNYRLGLGLMAILLVLCLVTELVSGIVRTALLGRDYTPKHATLMSRLGRWLTPRRAGRATTGTTGTTGRAERTVPNRPSSFDPDRVSPPWNGERIRRALWVGAVLVALVAALIGAQISVAQLEGGLGKALYTLGLYFPPSTAEIGDKLVGSMVETLQMALAGTLLGLVLATPIGVLAARNVAPPRVAAFFRTLVVCVRAIPGIIIGICFVVITGLGSTAGALALAIGAIGFFSKIIADSIEETDVRVQEAIRASGAEAQQVFVAATLRQVAPSLASHAMHQLDNDLRGATGLGVIGAGGIGFYMLNAARVLEYGVVTTCMLMILVSVLLVEGLALWTRREVK